MIDPPFCPKMFPKGWSTGSKSELTEEINGFLFLPSISYIAFTTLHIASLMAISKQNIAPTEQKFTKKVIVLSSHSPQVCHNYQCWRKEGRKEGNLPLEILCSIVWKIRTFQRQYNGFFRGAFAAFWFLLCGFLAFCFALFVDVVG